MTGNGSDALEAILTLAGQNTINHDALVDVLVQKGLISLEEFDEAMKRIYLDRLAEIGAAGWARRCISAQDNEALDAFFGQG